MPTPEFRWSEYEVRVPRTSPLISFRARLRSSSVAEESVTIPLPDLSAWQSPLDKAKILLESAAEIEHALMAQYLYAAYSLKSKKDVSDPAQKKVLDEDDRSSTSWPTRILGIAREEMGHLITVQNLLLALGLPPNLEREDFPPRKDLYPFALHLEPLSQHSLAKYVVAEAPVDALDIDDIKHVAQGSAAPSTMWVFSTDCWVLCLPRRSRSRREQSVGTAGTRWWAISPWRCTGRPPLIRGTSRTALLKSGPSSSRQSRRTGKCQACGSIGWPIVQLLEQLSATSESREKGLQIRMRGPILSDSG